MGYETSQWYDYINPACQTALKRQVSEANLILYKRLAKQNCLAGQNNI